MKPEYATWNDFINDCQIHELDPVREFRGVYDRKGDLVGTFTLQPGGGSVTYKPL